MRRVLMVVVAVAASIALSAQQVRDAPQAATTGTAQISGTVKTAETTPVPVRRAVVQISGDRGGRASAVTNDNGEFSFVRLPADRYSLSVTKSGFLPANYGSKRPGGTGTSIAVADGQMRAVAMNLLKGSVIVGIVRDGRGQPVPDVNVTAQRYGISSSSGERSLQNVTIGSSGVTDPSYSPDAFPGTGRTDDRGEYRIFGLAPGEYVVSASARSDRSILAVTDVYQISAADIQRAQQLLRAPAGAASGDPAAAAPAASSRVDYVPVYHPGALTAAEATMVVVGPAEERVGVDILLRLVPTAKVNGAVTAPDGTPLANAQVSLLPLPRTLSSGVQRSTRSNFDGQFSLAGVTPGRYEIQASTYPDAYFGSSEVVVDGRDVQASMVLNPGSTITGRIVFDGASKHPAFSSVGLLLRRHLFAIGGMGYKIAEDGKVTFGGVFPGTYRLGLNGNPPAGWILRSVTLNGVDISDVAFDVGWQNISDVVITLTDRPAEISGVLQNANGEPAPDYVLIVFSADPRFRVARTRRTQQVRPDLNGRFIVRDLPAGDYFISAVTDLENGQWHDAAFLNELAAANPIKISVAEGDKKVQDIRISAPVGIPPTRQSDSDPPGRRR